GERLPGPDAFDSGDLREAGRAERQPGTRPDEDARGGRCRSPLGARAGRLPRAPSRGGPEGEAMTRAGKPHPPHLLAWVISLLLAGCFGASRPARFYTLDPVQVRDSPGSTSTDAVLAVGPIDLPDYVDRPQIVTRTGSNELVIAEFDRWGGSLDKQI